MKGICQAVFVVSSVVTILATAGLILQFNPTKFDPEKPMAKLCLRVILFGLVIASLCVVYALQSV